MSLCVSLKSLAGGVLRGTEWVGDGLHVDTGRWGVTEVLELFIKAALKASEWK